jgi:hypothetical protein
MLLPPLPAPLSVSVVLKVIAPSGWLLCETVKVRLMNPPPPLIECEPAILVTDPLPCQV